MNCTKIKGLKMLHGQNIDLLVNDAGWGKNNRLKMVLTVLERLRSSCGIDDMINLRYVILNFIYGIYNNPIIRCYSQFKK